jgi:hypothetical protein
MIHHARETNTQVIWDLCHYGWPDHLNVFKPEFVRSFAGLHAPSPNCWRMKQTARSSSRRSTKFPFSRASGDVGYFYPYIVRRGFELKTQLVRAAIEGIEAVWSVLPETRILHADPAINIVADPYRPYERADAEGHRQAQYQAWDMLAGACGRNSAARKISGHRWRQLLPAQSVDTQHARV